MSFQSGKRGYIDTIDKIYKQTLSLNESLNISPVTEFTTVAKQGDPPRDVYYETKIIELVTPNGNTININGDNGGVVSLDFSGTYLLRYKGENAYYVYNGVTGSTERWYSDYSFYFSLSVVENRLPLKKWTVTDVINRLLDLAEPIRKGEKPRLKLNEAQAVKFDKVLAPELSFTKQTLRECLQEVGKVVHGEARLTPKKDETEKWFYEVSYDMYAGQEDSDVLYMPYANKGVQHVLENYASYLDSSTENLVNQLDKYSGVIVEPYKGGAKSVRTENQYVRIEDKNMLIATQYPIYSVDKLECVYADFVKGQVKAVDITSWLFEKSIYDTQLTSYTEAYPYSKAYGIYYTQGSKNIGGLNFKLEKAVFPAFNDYAIVNILKKATGDTGLTISDYPAMCFRVTYTPFYNARVAQTKSYYKDFIRPAALIFNQQSNVIESRYYGENLKGAIARLGNIEASLTYFVANLSQVPKAGQKFGKDYYISAVAVEILPTCIKFTVGLSKDFNRLSQYIGISSTKRYYEISQNQAVERNVLYREYIVIGEKEEPDSDSLIGRSMLAFIGLTFTPLANEDGESIAIGPVSNVIAWGTSYKENIINNMAVNLPVISSAFGNSISFSWKYEDNYSAGATSEYKAGAFSEGETSGYFQNDCKYTDYYGRLYYYDFMLSAGRPTPTAATLNSLSQKLPADTVPSQSDDEQIVSTIGKEPFILRKDNREALQVNFQIDFVTNIESLIIGSALASYSPAVRGNDAKLAPKLYVFPTELNKFTDHVEAFEDVDLNSMPAAAIQAVVDDSGGYFTVTADNFPASGKSWAIVTKQYTDTVMVEDEQGNPYEQTQYFGGDLLIGQNIEVTAGQAFTPIYFTKKREIFYKSVWKDRR